MKTKLTALLLTSTIAACTMTPSYERPSFPSAKKWDSGWAENQKAVAEEAQKTADEIPWRDFFKSPEMHKVIETALQNNRDLRIATLNIDAARAMYRIERSDLVPKLDAVGSATRTNYPSGASTTAVTTSSKIYEANLAVTGFELDFFGRIQSLSDSALEKFLATQEARNAVQISLIAETANAYLQYLADKKILKLTEETLAVQEKSYDLINKSFENGIGSKLDVAQVRTALETAKVNKALFARLVKQDKNALMLLLGTNDESILGEETTLDDITLEKNLQVGMPSEMLLRRPDIMQAEHSLLAENADIGAARAAFFPQISLTGSYGFASASLDDLFSSGTGGAWSFLPSITIPIFKGGENTANLDLQDTEKKIAIAEYEKAIQMAFKEVADELAARETLDEQMTAQRNLVESTQQAYDLSYARYKSGIDRFLSALDAQRSLFTAQQNYILLEKENMTNMINLYKALGGGNQQY